MKFFGLTKRVAQGQVKAKAGLKLVAAAARKNYTIKNSVFAPVVVDRGDEHEAAANAGGDMGILWLLSSNLNGRSPYEN